LNRIYLYYFQDDEEYSNSLQQGQVSEEKKENKPEGNFK